MRKVLLIAKGNDVMKSLHKELQGHFDVQLCAPSPSALMALMNMISPDLILMSLTGSLDTAAEICGMLQIHYSHIPVITMGTEGEAKRLERFYDLRQFENLIRPINNSDVVEAVGGKLGVTIMSKEQVSVLDSIFADAPDGILFPVEKGGKKSILIVDDNAVTLRSIKSILEPKYNVSVAPSGVKALAVMGKEKPDVIILDYEMPDMDGKQVFEMLQTNDEYKDIPVIFLTGVSDRTHIQAVLALRPAGYLLKPTNKDKLMNAIESALNK